MNEQSINRYASSLIIEMLHCTQAMLTFTASGVFLFVVRLS